MITCTSGVFATVDFGSLLFPEHLIAISAWPKPALHERIEVDGEDTRLDRCNSQNTLETTLHTGKKLPEKGRK